MRRKLVTLLLCAVLPLMAAGPTDFTKVAEEGDEIEPDSQLYLMHRAATYTTAPQTFEIKVRDIAEKLSIPPEWLMVIMHSESGFDPRVSNKKGSGAKGLLQWMPKTYKDFGVRRLAPWSIPQLDLVYEYLAHRKKYFGDFKTLTDLKLAVLYPKAVGKPHNFVLYSHPKKAYYQNIGLDMDGDCQVTVADVETWMMRDYDDFYFNSVN